MTKDQAYALLYAACGVLNTAAPSAFADLKAAVDAIVDPTGDSTPVCDAPGMRVRVDNPRSVGGFDFGVFVGLLPGEDDGPGERVLVRLDGFGLYCRALHGSRVMPVTPAEEESYKP